MLIHPQIVSLYFCVLFAFSVGTRYSISHSVGLSVEIPTGHCAVITSRSSASLQGLLVHVGIVDPAFSESLKVIVTNLTKDPILLLREIAVAQLVFIKTFSPQIKEIETIKTDRSGFGSSNHE